MWHYSGPEDSTRSHPEEVSEEVVAQWLRGITGACDNPLEAKRVLPFCAKNKPPNLDIGGESEGGSANNDYAEDSKGSEDDSEESEEEIESPPHIESRSKHHHDTAATPSKTLASSTRDVKRDRAATSELAEKAAKQPNPDAPKPRKALSRMRIHRSAPNVYQPLNLTVE
ncbi:hypothetical protein ZWY2020_028568 [Hordeum vulgare]|nr:hypothetical protein ZWY2020_028568 [Hordeum vulgare]